MNKLKEIITDDEGIIKNSKKLIGAEMYFSKPRGGIYAPSEWENAGEVLDVLKERKLKIRAYTGKILTVGKETFHLWRYQPKKNIS